MAPTRKSRNVNRRYSSVSDVSPSKEGESAKKGSSRKRKLADMLGPRWSSEELVSFYDAYRKHGEDWKKVAASLKTRSSEMVEALYSMNKAYLSLPHGTASAAGLSAMMVDHYSNLEGSDSDQESSDDVASSRKAQKRARRKAQQNSSKASYEKNASHSPSQDAASNLGILSFLKKKRSGGKRTPRVPVSFSNESMMGQKYASPPKQALKLKADANEDNVAHEIAVALAEASQKGGSPRKRGDSETSSPFRKHQRKNNVTEKANEKDLEENTEANRSVKEFARDGVVRSKGKKTDWKRFEFDGNNDKFLDDIEEECSGTEEGHRFGATRDPLTDTKSYWSSLQSQKKKSKKDLLRKDDSNAFDALQTLADLSLMMPSENEDGDDDVHKYTPSEALPENQRREKRRHAGLKMKGHQSMSSSEIPSNKSSKLSPPVAKQDLQSPAKTTRRKQKVPTSKKITVQHDIHSSESPGKEPGDVGKRLPSRPSQIGLPKLRKNSENSLSDDHKEASNSAQSAVQFPETNQDNLPTKVRRKRKINFWKPETLSDPKFLDKLSTEPSNLPAASNNDPLFNSKKYLSNCLSNPQLRRWCTYEWFYSAIDYPWFAKREFVEYLYHVGLGHVPRLSRVEWGVIRSSLGKPRRFSEHFLSDEKEKLNIYRESVRKHYTELRDGVREGLPTDLARPLSVGQRVIAIHPKTREIHDGSVLTVDHSRCRVQFDWPELGVEFVKDIDCMPLHPLENMPALLGRQVFPVDKIFDNFNELQVNGRPQDYMKLFPGGEDQLDSVPHLSPLPDPKQSKVASTITHTRIQTTNNVAYPQVMIPAKEADVQAVADLTRALDKKDAIVAEIRHLNDEVTQKGVDSSLKESEKYKKQYAAVLIQLNEANEQVSSALHFLRQRNMHPGNTALSWQRPVANIADTGRLSGFPDRPAGQTLEAGSPANEIVESSRTKARAMVDAAIKALKSKEERIEKMEDAIDYVNEQLPSDDAITSMVAGSKSKEASNLEAQIPSELISNCVATLLMIRKCTERQFPPSDVAQILDSVVTSLEPRSSQNHPIYNEIQKCMGIIRNQIMALIPTTI